MPDAAYYQAWRAAHPEYRAREAARSRQRERVRGDRSAEYARQRARRTEQRQVRSADNGWTEQAHPVLSEARDIASRQVRPDRRSVLMRPTFDDAVSEAALALLAGDDPTEAVQRYLRSERDWRWRTAPLLDAHLEVAA
jgi:hypothetical protein